jgi:hypothetical protein
MTPRCAHCSNRLTQDEVMYYGNACEACEQNFMRRWDDQYRGQPSKFAQRIAIVLAIAIILACVVVLKRMGGA